MTNNILTNAETQKNSMRARLRVLQSLDRDIAQEVRAWYEWEKMSPAYIAKVATMLQANK